MSTRYLNFMLSFVRTFNVTLYTGTVCFQLCMRAVHPQTQGCLHVHGGFWILRREPHNMSVNYLGRNMDNSIKCLQDTNLQDTNLLKLSKVQCF